MCCTQKWWAIGSALFHLLAKQLSKPLSFKTRDKFMFVDKQRFPN